MANPQPTKYRVQRKVSSLTLPEKLNPRNKKPHGKTHRRLSTINPKVRVTPHRKGVKPIKRRPKMSLEHVLATIVKRHGQTPSTVIEEAGDPTMVSTIAKQLMKTFMRGWKQEGNAFVYKDGVTFPASSFQLREDTSLTPATMKLDFDWLYELASAADVVTEDSYGSSVQDLDINRLADTLWNASKLLRSLSDNEVKKYILDRAHAAGQNTKIISQSLDDVGVNWRLENIKINGMVIDVIIRVKYSEDGTNNGVVEKTLSVEVRPGNEVRDYEG